MSSLQEESLVKSASMPLIVISRMIIRGILVVDNSGDDCPGAMLGRRQKVQAPGRADSGLYR